MRRLPPVLLLSLLLLGCGSGGGSDIACTQQFWNGTVGACLPDGWEVVPEDTLRGNGVPEETIVAFQAREAQDGQFTTVTVTKEPLAQDMTPQEYSEANTVAVSTLPEYDLIDKMQVTVDGADTQVHIFSARPLEEKPVRRYYQLSTTSERTGYTFTAALPLSVSDASASAVLSILTSATFADPTPVDETAEN